MAFLIGYPRFRHLLSDGTPAVGYKLYSYLAGTSTPEPTYTDQTQTAANPNPTILDGNGEAAIWLKANVAYKLVLKTDADVTVWTVDAINTQEGGFFTTLTATGQSTLADIDCEDILPKTDAIYSIGNLTRRFLNLWLSGFIQWADNGAQTGTIRLPQQGFIGGRNLANSQEVNVIGVDVSDHVFVGSGLGCVQVDLGSSVSQILLNGLTKLRAITYTAADTTPSVAGGNYMVIANAGAVSITAFDNGQDGQLVILKFSDANTTLVDSAGLQLAGGVNFVSSADDILTLIRIAGVWYEKDRSLN